MTSGSKQFVIQIVPSFNDRPDGVRDYAELLATKLSTGHQLQSHFVTWSDDDKSEKWPVVVSRKNARELGEALNGATQKDCVGAILHFSGYGFARRGVPIWLLRGLSRWRRQSLGPLITVFHEISATGRPWQSSFWLGPLQGLVSRGILDISDGVVVSTTRNRRTLMNWRAEIESRTFLLPVFATVGEPEHKLDVYRRPNSVVVFGLAETRRRLYEENGPAFIAMLRSLRIESIVDIGPGLDLGSKARDLEGVKFRALGQVTASQVSAELVRARYGALVYPTDLLGKSSVFAGFASHGVIPLIANIGAAASNTDGLVPGRHYLLADSLDRPVNRQRLLSIQSALGDWYKSHSAARQAAVFAAALLEERTSP